MCIRDSPGTNRIEPGDPQASYFMLKVRGEAGSQMPLGGDPLPDMMQMMIADWILGGANP